MRRNNYIYVCIVLEILLYIQCCLAFINKKDDLRSLFNRTDLTCPSYCHHHLSRLRRMPCCICQSQQVLSDVGKLYVSQKDQSTDAHIFNNGSGHVYYKIVYRHRNLSKLPVNICEFFSIVSIDFSFNRITNIDNISCLRYLDTLLLTGNKIEYLRNDTFLRMKYIRVIDLSYNKLRYIEPGFLMNKDGSLFRFNVSHNFLTEIDITNGLWAKQKYFCFTDFSHNRIKKISNELSWKFKLTSTFGHGGMVYLSSNQLTSFIDFLEIGFTNLLFIGRLLYYGFDLRNNLWMCDCKLFPFAQLARPLAQRMYRDYFNIKCFGPPNLKNKNMLNLIIDGDFKGLTCPLSMVDKCPPKCTCEYQPATENRTVISCSGNGLTKLPIVLPAYKDLEVDFSKNRIEKLDVRFSSLHEEHELLKIDNYLSRIRVLNLTQNRIELISDDILHLLENVRIIDLRENRIVYMQKAFRNLHPCQLLIGMIEMQCTCNDIWLQQWLPKSEGKCHGNVQVICRNSDRFASILNMTKTDLGCKIPDEFTVWTICSISGVFAFLAIFWGIMFTLRFECFILIRNFIKARKVKSSYLYYDVYISCDDDNENIRLWLTSELIPYLEGKKLNVYFPCRDNTLGEPRETEMIHVMSNTKNFLIILSEENHTSVRWYRKEWKYAWMNYQRDLGREIIIVNYDMLTRHELTKRYLGAFLRLGKVIDFSNRQKSIVHEIENSFDLPEDVLLETNTTSYNRNIINETTPLMTKYPKYAN